MLIGLASGQDGHWRWWKWVSLVCTTRQLVCCLSHTILSRVALMCFRLVLPCQGRWLLTRSHCLLGSRWGWLRSLIFVGCVGGIRIGKVKVVVVANILWGPRSRLFRVGRRRRRRGNEGLGVLRLISARGAWPGPRLRLASRARLTEPVV